MATDEDEDRKVFYSLHAARSPASLSIFKIDSVTGAVVLSDKLDRYYSSIVLNILTSLIFVNFLNNYLTKLIIKFLCNSEN
jgi:protocadherin Fat 1/2/3